jgi:hypothetical protein
MCCIVCRTINASRLPCNPHTGSYDYDNCCYDHSYAYCLHLDHDKNCIHCQFHYKFSEHSVLQCCIVLLCRNASGTSCGRRHFRCFQSFRWNKHFDRNTHRRYIISFRDNHLQIAVVGGIIGFLILALIIISVVLYILVRRSVEKRARDREYLRESKLYNEEARSSVAASASASDTPEDELREMEPSFWGVVTRPKQALRVVNG